MRKHIRNVLLVSVVCSVTLVPEAINPFLLRNSHKSNSDQAYLDHYDMKV